ncbi:MAG: hypothetical protein ACP5LE_07880, partial [Thermoplasmata archaeon]
MEIEVVIDSIPLPGYSVCGDSAFVIEGERMLIACCDGLGHGQPAHEAVELAESIVRKNAEKDICEIMRILHEELRKSVGAAVGIVAIDKSRGTLEYCGVGNIDLRAYSKLEFHPVSVPGIVGYNMRKCIVYTTYVYPD